MRAPHENTGRFGPEMRAGNKPLHYRIQTLISHQITGRGGNEGPFRVPKREMTAVKIGIGKRSKPIRRDEVFQTMNYRLEGGVEWSTALNYV